MVVGLGAVVGSLHAIEIERGRRGEAGKVEWGNVGADGGHYVGINK